jgi:hypothetical protein
MGARVLARTSEVFEIEPHFSRPLDNTRASPDPRTCTHLYESSRSVIERVPAPVVELESTCARARRLKGFRR